jgi:hypothetical protein
MKWSPYTTLNMGQCRKATIVGKNLILEIMRYQFFLLLLTFIIASSCQKHLDRTDAKRMIVTNKNYPIKQNFKITKAYIKDMHTDGFGVFIVLDEDENKEKEKSIRQFESIGLLNFAETLQREESETSLGGTRIRTWISVKVELTESGRKYLVSENEESVTVNLWETDVKEITGIQERPELKVAKVEYVLYNSGITPFGSIFSDKNNEDKMTSDFSLYDDGWRIQ